MYRFVSLGSCVGSILLAAACVLAQNAPARLPVPTEAAQSEALNIIREVYKADYEKAKTTDEKRAMARKMVERAAETKSDAASQYVLLRTARDIATQIGDAETAFAAIDEMGRAFQVDGLPMKLAVLSKGAAMARLPAEHKAVAEWAMALVEEAVAADQYDLAAQVAQLALGAARKANDAAVLKEVRVRAQDVEDAAAAFPAVAAAAKILDEKPLDAQANVVVGKHECLVKGRWERGVPMLALGNDAAFTPLARQELADPKVAAAQVKLGDGWWDLAEKHEGNARRQLQGRAAHWYRQAVGSLTGFIKDKVQKRLEEAAGGSPLQPGGAASVTRSVLISVHEPWPVWLPVEKGQTVHIKATGRWRVRPGGKWQGPDDKDFYLQGRLAQGEPFRVGGDFTLPVKEDGQLFLGMREGGDYQNNSGEIRAEITVSR